MDIHIHIKPLDGKHSELHYSNVWSINVIEGKTHSLIRIKKGETFDKLIQYKNKDYINVSVEMNKK